MSCQREDLHHLSRQREELCMVLVEPFLEAWEVLGPE